MPLLPASTARVAHLVRSCSCNRALRWIFLTYHPTTRAHPCLCAHPRLCKCTSVPPRIHTHPSLNLQSCPYTSIPLFISICTSLSNLVFTTAHIDDFTSHHASLFPAPIHPLESFRAQSCFLSSTHTPSSIHTRASSMCRRGRKWPPSQGDLPAWLEAREPTNHHQIRRGLRLRLY